MTSEVPPVPDDEVDEAQYEYDLLNDSWLPRMRWLSERLDITLTELALVQSSIFLYTIMMEITGRSDDGEEWKQ